jgi:hypothetical protein
MGKKSFLIRISVCRVVTLLALYYFIFRYKRTIYLRRTDCRQMQPCFSIDKQHIAVATPPFLWWKKYSGYNFAISLIERTQQLKLECFSDKIKKYNSNNSAVSLKNPLTIPKVTFLQLHCFPDLQITAFTTLMFPWKKNTSVSTLPFSS